MTETTSEYVKRCVEANDKARFAASGLLGEIIVSQTSKVLTGQQFGNNLIPYSATAWIADNIHEAICRFVEAVEREAEGNMLKTGKLEGSHYAAMKRIVRECSPNSVNKRSPLRFAPCGCVDGQQQG
jgi:hypothetical protein